MRFSARDPQRPCKNITSSFLRQISIRFQSLASTDFVSPVACVCSWNHGDL
jgi:hypothetical protein